MKNADPLTGGQGTSPKHCQLWTLSSIVWVVCMFGLCKSFQLCNRTSCPSLLPICPPQVCFRELRGNPEQIRWGDVSVRVEVCIPCTKETTSLDTVLWVVFDSSPTQLRMRVKITSEILFLLSFHNIHEWCVLLLEISAVNRARITVPLPPTSEGNSLGSGAKGVYLSHLPYLASCFRGHGRLRSADCWRQSTRLRGSTSLAL